MRYFSVVMPVYNKEKYVAASIQSILDQTYPYFELIVVDDGSTDGSADVIASVTDDRIRYIRQTNGGESAARNNGIRQAAHGYIAFLDSDDLWLPDYLERINALIDKYPEAGAYGCAYLHEPVVDGTLQKAASMEKDDTEHVIENYFEFVMSHQQSLTASTTTVRRSVFEKAGGFPVGLRNWVDLDLWARIGLYFNVVFTERVCAIYNDLPDSVSKVKVKLHAPTFDDYKKYLRSEDITKERKKTFLEYVIRQKMYSAYQQYLLDQNGWQAFKELLPYWYTKRNRRSYCSMMIQFLITTERFYKIHGFIKGNRT